MIEQTILSNLITNEEYNRKVLPFIQLDYFTTPHFQAIFSTINKYMDAYNKLPTKEALLIELENEKLGENDYSAAVESVGAFTDQSEAVEWLVDKTEEFCQNRAIYNSIMDSIAIIDGRDKKRDRGAIPELLSQALAVSFNRAIGHDFLSDAEERYEFYTRPENKMPFDIDILNKITKGGFSNKTLNILIAGTGVGKTLMMCHMAAANLMQQKNVLYITMEMAEERIAERIDANLLDISLNDMELMPRDNYMSKIDKLKKKTHGRLFVKEYPTASAHVGHFRHLINELRLKKDFTPDIIYIDYINICASSRIKPSTSGTYQYVKFVAEEIRGFAVENNVPIISATQLNRGGLDNSDVNLSETSESIGLPFTADFMLAVMQTEDMRELNQFLCKQLKNRYNDMGYFNKFVIGVDKSKMRLYEIDQKQDNKINDDLPVFDGGEITARFNKERLKDLTV